MHLLRYTLAHRNPAYFLELIIVKYCTANQIRKAKVAVAGAKTENGISLILSFPSLLLLPTGKQEQSEVLEFSKLFQVYLKANSASNHEAEVCRIRKDLLGYEFQFLALARNLVTITHSLT